MDFLLETSPISQMGDVLTWETTLRGCESHWKWRLFADNEKNKFNRGHEHSWVTPGVTSLDNSLLITGLVYMINVYFHKTPCKMVRF